MKDLTIIEAEEPAIQDGIKTIAKTRFGDNNVDAPVCFMSYISMLSCMEGERLEKYINKTLKEAREKHNLKRNIYPSFDKAMGLVFGRDAYLYYASSIFAVKENCYINPNGEMHFGNMLVTGNDDEFMKKLSSRYNLEDEKFLEELGYEEEELPNIDDEDIYNS